MNRHSITIATAGHVDHGKTSLVTRLTGTDTDTLAEEKIRGLSINLGFAYRHLDSGESQNTRKLSVGFIDVPGHTDFINNALAGLGCADFALLVVAADDGVMPQTREHLSIVNLMGIDAGAVVITKIDMATEEQTNDAVQQVKDLLAESSFANVPTFKVSSVTGRGIDKLQEYLERIIQDQCRQPPVIPGNARFAIDRSFTVKGIGTVVTGTLLAGKLKAGDQLRHTGSGAVVRTRALRHDKLDIQQAVSGERLAININLPHQQVSRGDWLVNEAQFVSSNRMDVKLTLLEDVEFKSGIRFHLYHGTSHHLVQIRQLGGDYFQVTSQSPFFAAFSDHFILRDPACKKTLGGGTVVEIHVPRRGRASDARLKYLKTLDQADLPALASLVNEQSGGISLEQLCSTRNWNPQHFNRLLDQLDAQGIPFLKLPVAGGSRTLLIHQKFIDEIARKLLATMNRYHKEHFDQPGVTEQVLAKISAPDIPYELIHGVLEQLLKAGTILKSGTLLRLPSHEATLTREEQQFLDHIRPYLAQAGYIPPRTRELAELLDMKLATLERNLAVARRKGLLTQVSANRHYLPETIEELARFTRSLALANPDGFTVIQFRDESGIGRNLCIEILEYFDRTGLTMRRDNTRLLRKS